MAFRIVADSSSNILNIPGADYVSVPLKIISANREYVDDIHLDVAAMAASLKAEKTAATTSCPNMQEWRDAFEGADAVFSVTITSNLSGSYNAALQAAGEFKRSDSDRRICVLDTLSTGPEMQLIIEKLLEYDRANATFDQARTSIRQYMKHTHLLFALQSLNNLAKNGRVNPAVAKVAGVLGVRAVGKASDQGTLELLHKCRGERKALEALLSEMAQGGFNGGKVRISHGFNQKAAEDLQSIILSSWPGSDVEIIPNGGLCTYYADLGGLLVGYEDRL